MDLTTRTMAADITEDSRPGSSGSAAHDPEGVGVLASGAGMVEREEPVADDGGTSAESVAITSETRRGVDETAYVAKAEEEEDGESSPAAPAPPGSRGKEGGTPAAPTAAAAVAAATPAAATPAAPTRKRDKKKRGKGGGLDGNPAMSVEDLFVTISTVQVGT